MAFADDFSDGPDEDPSPPLLPREDRIWRHPSELGAAEQPFVLDPLLVRRRWLSSQPTRASAWTAGLVGALLATGLVVLGTHLASAFTSPRTTGADLRSQNAAPLTSGLAGPVSTVAASGAADLPVTSTVSAMINRVAASTATIEATVNGHDSFADALVLSSAGDLITPLSALDGASSVLVTQPGGGTYVGDVVALDENTGVAVLRVSEARGLRAAPFDTSTPVSGQLVLAPGGAGGPLAWVGTVRSVGDVAGRASWPVDFTADVPPSRVLVGAPLVDGDGRVSGLVLKPAASGGGVLAVPAWLAAPVGDRLLVNGTVPHGWLGVLCTDAYDGGRPVGARVLQVDGAPARGALQQNDVISAIDGAPVSSYLALESRLYALPPGAPVALTVLRGGTARTVDLRLGAG